MVIAVSVTTTRVPVRQKSGVVEETGAGTFKASGSQRGGLIEQHGSHHRIKLRKRTGYDETWPDFAWPNKDWNNIGRGVGIFMIKETEE